MKLRTIILRLVCAIIVSLLAGAFAGWMALQVPCDHFGSNFEGACGYAGVGYAFGWAMYTSIAVMVIGTALALLYPARED